MTWLVDKHWSLRIPLVICVNGDRTIMKYSVNKHKEHLIHKTCMEKDTKTKNNTTAHKMRLQLYLEWGRVIIWYLAFSDFTHVIPGIMNSVRRKKNPTKWISFTISIAIWKDQLKSLKAYSRSNWFFFVYIKSCQYSMFYTNKMFWTRSQVKKIYYNVVISEKNSNVCW